MTSSARNFLFWILAWFAKWLYLLYYATVRIKVVNEPYAPDQVPPGEKWIFVFWHSKTFLILPRYRGLKIGILTLLDPKNLFYAALCRHYGYQTVPVTTPSSATRQLKELLDKKFSVALALDGPHGPAGVIKPGAFYLAKATKTPLVAMDTRIDRTFRLAWRWDRFEVPWPFAQATIRLSPPIRTDLLSTE